MQVIVNRKILLCKMTYLLDSILGSLILQLDNTVKEKELVGIVQGFKAYEGILWGQEVTVHTNYLNLLYQNASL